MTALARLFLVLTSVAPIAFVYAAILFEGKHLKDAGVAAATACAFLLISLALLWGTARYNDPIDRQLDEVTTKEGEPLAFLIAYALPLATTREGGSTLGLVAFAFVMIVTLWQQQIVYMNPVLALVGFSFFAGKTDDGSTVLVLTRNKVLGKGKVAVVTLSNYLWLDCSNKNDSTASA